MLNTPPQSTEHPPGSDRVFILNANPTTSASLVEAAAAEVDALVIIGYANGSASDSVAEGVSNVIASGKPVFFLSDNEDICPAEYYRPRNEHGVIVHSDVPQFTLMDAGAVLIERINIKSATALTASVGEAIVSGLSGQALSDYIQDMYRLPEEDRPEFRLGNPAYYNGAYRASVNRTLGLPPDTPLIVGPDNAEDFDYPVDL